MTRGKKRPATEEPSKHKAPAGQAEPVCERCGRPMVDLQIPTLLDEGGPRHAVTWRCPACGHRVQAHSLGHHHEESGLGGQEGKR